MRNECSEELRGEHDPEDDEAADMATVVPSKDQPNTSSRNTGRATTNQMWREPNGKKRAAASRLMATDSDRIDRKSVLG